MMAAKRSRAASAICSLIRKAHLLKNKVHPADIHDRAGAELLLEGLQHLFPAIRADVGRHGLSRIEGLAAQSAGLEVVDPAALVERRRLDAG